MLPIFFAIYGSLHRVDELWPGIAVLFQIVLGKEVICLRTSMAKGPRVWSEVAVGKPVGTPDGSQWMRFPEWSVDPLSAIALAQGRI